MDHPGQRMLRRNRGDQVFGLIPVGHVGGDHGRHAAALGQLGDELGGTVGVRPAPADEHQAVGTVDVGEVARDQRPKRARAARDQDRAVAAEVRGVR